MVNGSAGNGRSRLGGGCRGSSTRISRWTSGWSVRCHPGTEFIGPYYGASSSLMTSISSTPPPFVFSCHHLPPLLPSCQPLIPSIIIHSHCPVSSLITDLYHALHPLPSMSFIVVLTLRSPTAYHHHPPFLVVAHRPSLSSAISYHGVNLHPSQDSYQPHYLDAVLQLVLIVSPHQPRSYTSPHYPLRLPSLEVDIRIASMTVSSPLHSLSAGLLTD